MTRMNAVWGGMTDVPVYFKLCEVVSTGAECNQLFVGYFHPNTTAVRKVRRSYSKSYSFNFEVKSTGAEASPFFQVHGDERGAVPELIR